MSRKIPFALGEFYHIYNRGVDKRVVFENDHDRNRFILLLYLCNGEIPINIENPPRKGSTFFEVDVGKPIVAIGAYCLMLNHFHILIREISEDGISKFMHKLSTAYTMYFNGSRDRAGALFQGRFKAKHADSDEYLKYLFSYIHLNPLKIINANWKNAGIDSNKSKNFLSSYVFSSYLDYKGSNRKSEKILNRQKFPEYFPTKTDFDSSISDWISIKC